MVRESRPYFIPKQIIKFTKKGKLDDLTSFNFYKQQLSYKQKALTSTRRAVGKIEG